MDKIVLAGCVILKEGKILLLHRLSKDWFELPGGAVEEGESPEVAAIREIKEELLCEVKIVKPLGEKDFAEGEKVFNYLWFLAETLPGEEPKVGEPDHYDKFEYFSFDELPDLNLSGNMKNFLAEYSAGKIPI